MSAPRASDDTHRPPRILVAIALDDQLELDPASRRITEQALWLAERCGGRVRFMHVIEDLGDDREDVEGGLDAEQREATLERIESLLKILCHQATRAGVDASAAIAAGRPSREILHEAWHWPADLLVVGPHLGHEHDADDHPLLDRIDRLVHGSTAHRVVRKAPCAVWVVSSQGPPGISRVLVTTKLGPQTDELVALAERLHELAGVERALLHCLEFSDDLALNLRADAQAILEACEDDLAAEVERKIAALLGEQRGAWHIELRAGPIDKILGEVVEALDCDLVIAGSAAHETIGGAVLGDMIGRIIDRAPASTWVVRTASPRMDDDAPSTRPLTPDDARRSA